MNRILPVLFFLLIISGVYLYGKSYHSFRTSELVIVDTTLLDWEEELAEENGIPIPALRLALNGYYALETKGLLKNDSLLTIIDFSSPSTAERLFIVDLKNKKLLKNTLVAHGMQTGVNEAESFSNKRNSNKSSLGLFLTGETYEGKHGYSLRLDGMSEGLNDNARKRAIVIHGADYVNDDFIAKHGRIGRSFGCPAVPMDEVNGLIDLIKGGSCLYIYHPSILPISEKDLERLP